jgi:hypothetical protein
MPSRTSPLALASLLALAAARADAQADAAEQVVRARTRSGWARRVGYVE